MELFGSLTDRIRKKIKNIWIVNKTRLIKLSRRLYSSQHQLTSTTSTDRYPALFAETRKALTEFNKEQGKLLSFGCSTGEECFSLRNYFPHNAIIGADINRWNLRKARNKNTDSAIKFIYSSDETLAAEGKYTAIFCLSVLCRWEDTKDLADCSDVYPFWRFDETVSFLSEQLEENGILVIYNSNFRFEDTAVSGGFEILSTPAMSDSGFVHKFDSYNKRIYLHHRHCIYRKKATAKP